jgi:hypothetical protein
MFFFFLVLGIELRALSAPGRFSATELYSQLPLLFYSDQLLENQELRREGYMSLDLDVDKPGSFYFCSFP